MVDICNEVLACITLGELIENKNTQDDHLYLSYCVFGYIWDIMGFADIILKELKKT